MGLLQKKGNAIKVDNKATNSKQSKTKKDFKEASNRASESVKNWYADRYSSLLFQRSMLFIFTIISAVAVLISLTLVKSLYEQKSIDPYLIEINKQSNMITAVEQSSQKEYTAQESIKDYFIIQYLTAREAFNRNDVDEKVDLVRVLSNKNVFSTFSKTVSERRSEINKVGKEPLVTLNVESVVYITPTRVEIRFERIITAEENKKMQKKFVLILGFAFVDLKITLKDRRLNPLGFQVTSYLLQEKTFI